MSTEAGKRLVEAPSMHWQLCGLPLGEGECTCSLPDWVAAIEVEAVAAVLRELREEVQRLPTATRYFSDEDPPLRVVAMRSVLDAIDRRLGDD